ncbi:unnamed protein product [Bursaphelenchus okinawaensis]|uniref:Phosphoserine phosphatase n=1 Tax=Bursaphelenchus okinawaensis TaxID=465554 RepID=A0A811KXG5_9BILA|nr:unnamed protein product [Bursaphelenchus okinawaensis]CAG9112667.1 unnamed protein product [Bursaphelenchus okinawaensis]
MTVKNCEKWIQSDAVCFDVDSTVCQDEAIDELAEFVGKGDIIRRFTANAMDGNLNFRESLQKRMEIISVTKQKLDEFLLKHPIKLTLGISELVARLQKRGVAVYLVSGGFKEIIYPVARLLNISEDNVFANRIIFDANGKYVGFDPNEPTSDSGDKSKGKPLVCQLLKQKYGYKCLTMVGDGATDLEAYPPADLFIGFGGNQVRERVRKASPWYVTSFTELIDALR